MRFETTVGTFRAIQRCVAIAAGRDDSWPVLTGVHIVGTTDGLRFEATDSYRFHRATIEAGTDVDAVVPARWLRKIDLPRGKWAQYVPVEMRFEAERAIVEADGMEWSAPLLAGTFPNGDSIFVERADETTMLANPGLMADCFKAIGRWGGWGKNPGHPMRATLTDKVSRFSVDSEHGKLDVLLAAVREP